jgi:hypothetical protein
MPNALIKKYAKQAGVKKSKVEKVWHKLEKEYGVNYKAINGSMKEIFKAKDSRSIIEDTNRRLTGFGQLRIDNCILTAESVDGYLGRELKSSDLPTNVIARLEDDRIYQVYRPASVLKKAIDSYNLIPLTDNHHFVDSRTTNKKEWLGGIGNKARFVDGKIVNDLAIWDKNEVIKQLKLKDDISQMDFEENVRNSLTMEKPRDGLSGGYGFKLLDESGQWNGKHYDFKMSDIECNHVALVAKPRVGVSKLADSLVNILTKGNQMDAVKLIERLTQTNPKLIADTSAEMEKEAEMAGTNVKKIKDKVKKKKGKGKDSYKESTKGGAHSTDKKTDADCAGKDSLPEVKTLSDADVQEIVKKQLAEQLTNINKARDICERAIGKTSFAADATPESMYDETLKALKIDHTGYAIDTKYALLKQYADTKAAVVTAKHVPLFVADSANDGFKAIEI